MAEFCPRGAQPALAAPGKKKRQHPFCGKNEQNLHALSLTRRAKRTGRAPNDWDETTSAQFSVLHETPLARHLARVTASARRLRGSRATRVIELPPDALDRPWTRVGGLCGVKVRSGGATSSAAPESLWTRGRAISADAFNIIVEDWRSGDCDDGEFCRRLIHHAVNHLHRTDAVLRNAGAVHDIAHDAVIDARVKLRVGDHPMETFLFILNARRADWHRQRRKRAESPLPEDAETGEVALPPEVEFQAAISHQNHAHDQLEHVTMREALHERIEQLPAPLRGVVEAKLNGERKGETVKRLGISNRTQLRRLETKAVSKMEATV